MKKHLTVKIQVGVNKGENWHLGESLESRDRGRTDLQGKNTVWWAWKAKMEIYKREENTRKEFNTLS